jgi:hypothetical protein
MSDTRRIAANVAKLAKLLPLANGGKQSDR